MTTSVTGADLGYLAVLSRDNANSPMTFTQIAEVVDIPGFGAMSDLVEVTHLNSPNGAKEYISGLEDGVELAIKANLRLDSATQSYAAGLIHDQRLKSTRTFTLTHPQWGGTFRFDALVRGFAIDIKPNEAQVATFTLKITGGLTFF